MENWVQRQLDSAYMLSIIPCSSAVMPMSCMAATPMSRFFGLLTSFLLVVGVFQIISMRVIRRRILRPVIAVRDQMGEISQGNLSAEFQWEGDRDWAPEAIRWDSVETSPAVWLMRRRASFKASKIWRRAS